MMRLVVLGIVAAMFPAEVVVHAQMPPISKSVRIGNGEMKRFCNGTSFDSHVILKEDIDCSSHGFVDDPLAAPFPFPLSHPHLSHQNRLPFLFDISQGPFELDCKGHSITLPVIGDEMGFGVHVVVGPGSKVKNCHFIGGTVGVLYLEPPEEVCDDEEEDGDSAKQVQVQSSKNQKDTATGKFSVENSHFKGPMLVGVGHHTFSTSEGSKDGKEGTGVVDTDLINLHLVNVQVGVWWKPASMASEVKIEKMYMMTTHDGACIRALHGNMDVNDFVCHRTVTSDVEHHGEEAVIITSKADKTQIKNIPEGDEKVGDFLNGASSSD